MTGLSGFRNFLIISTEFPPGPGGIGNHAYNLAKYLKLNGDGVTVLTVSDFAGEDEKKKFEREQKFRIIRFRRFKSRIKTYKCRISLIKKTVREGNYSHIIFSGRSSLMAILLLKRLKKNSKFISIAHGGDINPGNSFEKLIVNKALMNPDLIIPVSKYSASKIDESIDISKIKVIPNGFDLDDSSGIVLSGVLRKKPGSALNLISVGTIWPRKGHHNVLEALPEIISDHPGTVYHIVGREADTSLCSSYFSDKNLKNKIKVYGQVSNNKLYDLLNTADIFILLSETQSSGDFEGFGIAVIEANCYGIPSIGSFNSGLEDSINDGVSGILVDPKNKEQIRKAVSTIFDNYERFSRGAKTWADSHHWSEIIKLYYDAFENIN